MDDMEDLGVRAPRCLTPASPEVLPRVSKRQLRHRQEAVGYDIPGTQTIFLKTYGCAHNSSDGEYMAGQLVAHGYGITEDFDAADAYLLNSCTVKTPSEAHLLTMIQRARATGKPVIVAGCVPQGDPKHAAWEDVSVVGVQQIPRVAEVVEEALRGSRVHLFGRGKNGRPGLDLPKIRRNRWVEIVPINTGCLNQCTYCKTKHARGHLSSWPIHEICDRIRQVVAEGVVEIRLTSEDTGAYGRDIGTNIAELLRAIVPLIPDGVMLRLGMTNPPYILEHLDAVCQILNEPVVYSYLHIPVQSGSNRVLDLMKREYTIQEFRYIVGKLRSSVPGIAIATDVICGFPGETDEDFDATLRLCEELKFPFLNISQFYSRHGTPAASMKALDSKVIKQRSRRITQTFEAYADCFLHLVGTTQRVYVTEVAADGHHLVGHTKCYTQILISPDEASLGDRVDVEVLEVAKWSAKGRVVGRPDLPPPPAPCPPRPPSACDEPDGGCCDEPEGECCGGAAEECGCAHPPEPTAGPRDLRWALVLGLGAALMVGLTAWRARTR